ncbi:MULTISPECIES: BCCT family transporter [Thermocrispum]|uniref:BCCT family transporter n=1 Tax=Thermocrispum agreste TaxID=37925 RepID=A0ABD6FAC3_9PSEU|nr:MULTISPECIES: BCCT family transporter [Thermocrispum]
MFWPAAAIVIVFVVAAAVWPTTMNDDVMAPVQMWIVEWFGSYYTLLVTGFVAFSLWIGLGHFGDIKLGKDDDEPEFGVLSWFCMLFAAGMGIGLVFWGVAEPLSHYAGVPNRAAGAPSGMTDEGVHESLVTTFLHWGLHPWAIYVVVGVAIAYAVHRKGKPVSIRWTLQPIFGNKVRGWIGDVVDIAAIVGTLFGVATSLGLGVLQIGSGLSFLEIIGGDPGKIVYIVLIGAITLMATVSVVTGVRRGIRWLSNINMGLAAVLLFFVAVAGASLFLAREFVEAVGLYFQELVKHSFNTTALAGEDGTAWQGWWTAFYWGWWISWAPFVGVFIARISKGRTVRQFVAAVLLVPATLAFVWFTVFGGTALNEERNAPGTLIARGQDGQPLLDADGNNISVNVDNSLFELLDGFPGGKVLVGVAIILVVLFFVTSSDSGSLVVDMLASGGHPEPPTWSRVFWSVMEGAIAAVLLTVGDQAGLTALRYAAIIIALPFSVVMILMCWASLKQFRAEREIALRIQRRQQQQELTEHVTQNLIEDGLVEPNNVSGGR